MSTNKKFRIQNGVDIKGEMSFNNTAVIDEFGNVVAASLQTGVYEIVDQAFVNGLNITATVAQTAESVTSVSGFTTSDIPQGSNLYFTTEAARGAVQGGDGIDYNQLSGEFSLNLTAGNGLSVTGSTVSLDGSAISQNLVPALDDVYSLGSPDKVWRDVYIGPGSLYINGTKILEDNSGTITMYADSGQNLSFGTTGGGVIDLNAGAESIQVKSNFILSSGKTITTVGGVPTQFGGDVELNGNCIFGVASPQTDGEAANKGYVDARVDAASIAGSKTFQNNVTVDGNLTVHGTTTTVNSETISLADNIIDLNSNVTSGDPTENGGIRILRGDEAAAQIRWNEALDQWEVFNGSVFTKIALSTTDLVQGTNEYYTDAKVNALLNPAKAVLEAADLAESTARAAADVALQGQIDANDSDQSVALGLETTRATAVEQTLEQLISAEVVNRIDGDAALQIEVDANESKIGVAEGKISTLESQMATSISNRAELQGDIATEASVRASADSDLLDSITGESSTRATADAQLQSALDSLTGSVSSIDTAYKGADSDLGVSIALVDAKVDTILGSSPEALDTLQEIVSAFQAADGSLNSVITNNSSRLTSVENGVTSLQSGVQANDADILSLQTSVSDLQSDLSDEVGFRTSKDSDLESSIDSEVQARQSADATLQSNITAEATSRSNAITAVNTAISNEATTRGNAVAQLQSDISTETSRALGVEGTLNTAIVSEASTRASADTALSGRVTTLESANFGGQITTESTTRESADNLLSGRISTLESEMDTVEGLVDSDRSVVSSLDSTLRGLITAESSARAAADVSLQGQIDFIKTNTDSAALDSLAEIVAAFQNADANLVGSVASNGASIASLEADMNSAQSSIANHGSRIGVVEGKVTSIESWNTDNLPQGTTNKYWTAELTKSVLTGGLCITYNSATGEIKIDEAEVASSLHTASSSDANALGGQSPTYYRIDIYDINGTIVN